MLHNLYDFEHGIHLHFWDIPALILIAVIIVMIILHIRNAKKREKEFEDEV